MLIVSFIFLTTYISVYEQMGHNAGVADTVAARTRNIRQRLRLGWYVGKTSMWVGESMEDHFADVWNRSLNMVEMEISCRGSNIPYACVRTRLALDGSLLCPAGCLASRWSSVSGSEDWTTEVHCGNEALTPEWQWSSMSPRNNIMAVRGDNKTSFKR